MKIIGIIAEYNPFHNGHAYQIEKIRRETGADYIIIAMSGDFVQRGTPALTDKYTRTEMALRCGADLVFELPVLFSCASAEYFARAGVSLFEKTGCTDGLCFGAETDNLPLLSSLAEFLCKEPPDYRDMLSSYIKNGMTFPQARILALAGSLAGAGLKAPTEPPAAPATPAPTADPGTLMRILESPNNILAVEYLKALRRSGSSMRPYVIRREGAGYHDTALHASASDGGSDARQVSAFADRSDAPRIPASASGIRQLLLSDFAASRCKNAEAYLATVMPAPAAALLAAGLREYPPVTADDFSAVLGYRLLSMTADELASAADCSPEIANRLQKNRAAFSSFTSFAAACKSRDVTRTRMNRILLHTVLSVTNEDYRHYSAAGYIPYLRILGFRRASAAVLTRIKECASVPMISKLADTSVLLPPDAHALLEKDIYASELYAQTRHLKALSYAETCMADTVREQRMPHLADHSYVQKKTTPRSEYTREIVLV